MPASTIPVHQPPRDQPSRNGQSGDRAELPLSAELPLFQDWHALG